MSELTLHATVQILEGMPQICCIYIYMTGQSGRICKIIQAADIRTQL